MENFVRIHTTNCNVIIKPKVNKDEKYFIQKSKQNHTRNLVMSSTSDT